MSHEASVSFGGRTWSLQTYHTDHTLSSPRSDVPWILLGGGLLLTALLLTPALIRVRGLCQDGKTLAKTRKSLDESTKRFEAIVDSMADWVWEVDAEGRYTYCSSRVQEILGYAPEEVLASLPSISCRRRKPGE